MNILEIVTDLRIGGAQRVAANIAKYAPEDYHFTYLVFDKQAGEYEPEIQSYGNDVIHIPSPKKGYLAYFHTLRKLMHEKKYDIVHCHNMYSCGLVMLAAKMSGIPGRIPHSHTAKDNILHKSFYRSVYKKLMRDLIWLCSTDYLACGEDAGEELYGKQRFSEHGIVIKNGIDTEAYKFSEEARNTVRKRYNLNDQFVIGHVGHYVEVKNQAFLIGLMPKILKKRPDTVLLLFGEGEDRSVLQAKIDSLGLSSSVRLMGNVSDIPRVLSALDVFAFPSILEGTPLALLEAQANGLPCLISDTVPDDACITDLVQKLPLSDESAWLEAITEAKREPGTDHTSILAERYEDIHVSMSKLYSIFEKYNHRR